MSHNGSSPRNLDLFEVTLTIPTPASEPAPASAMSSEVASLSDAQLAKHLGQLLQEVERRMERGWGSRPDLEAAVKQANASFDRLAPQPTKQNRRREPTRPPPALQEGQRKAVRAALAAGVAPSQVAKHFGLPLTSVRKVFDDAR